MNLSNKEMIQKAVDKMSTEFPNEDKKKYITLLTKIIEEGVYPKDAMGLSDEFIEMLYAYAYKLFQSGKFEEAATTYKFLMTVSPADIRHPMALAACFHKMQNYTGALTTYIACTFIAPDDPMPYYHASDCFLKLNDPEKAIGMLKFAVEKAKAKPEYTALQERAERSIEHLQGTLDGKKIRYNP